MPITRLQLGIAAIWAIGTLAVVALWPAPPAHTTGVIQISIASGGNKTEWLSQAIRDFDSASQRDARLQLDGRPISVTSLQEDVNGRQLDYRSGTMVADTLSGKIQPTILSPGEETWIHAFQDQWQSQTGHAVASDVGPVLVRTPLVIAMWRSRAEALGCWPTPGPECTWQRIRTLAASGDGWGTVGHPDWGTFKFGYGYVGEANTGTFAAALMCMIGAGKANGLATIDVNLGTGCGAFMAGIEMAKTHSGTRSDWLLEEMISGGPAYLDAIVAYELDIVQANLTRSQDLPEPLVAVYPQDGTVMVGHPFTILDGVPWVSPDQVAAARIFESYLLSDAVQQAVVPTGLRPADASLPLASPIDPAHGADPQARLVTLDVPGSQVMQRIVDVWHKVKKHAVVALVFQKSGSMAGPKLAAAILGAQQFVKRMDPEDQLIWRPFDDTIHTPTVGHGAQVGGDLVNTIGSTPAGGGSALYDAVLAAYSQLEDIRSTRGDTVRYGIVVLSDGHDTSSQTSLADLESRLRADEADPTGIQIHTIAIGADVDEEPLWEIATAAHGTFWTGQTTDDMTGAYRDIATYY